jgi:hypothetical protein
VTSTTPPPSGATSQATTPSSSNASGQTPAANAAGSATQPSATQNPGTAATAPAPANSGSAQRSNTQAPSGTAAQTPSTQQAQTPSTQQQATQPNPNAGTQQPTQPNTTAGAQATQPNGAAQQNAQQNQAPGGVVSLNVQQRTQIGQTLARHNVKPVTNVNFSISVGTAVPRSVQLNALPADLVTIVPQYRGYSYFVVEEQIVIVEPSSTKIVAVIPYAGGTATHAAAPAPSKSRAVKLSTEEREVIRRHTSARRSDAPTPARKASRHYSVGDEVETTETIETFPETVYREAPSVRPYRYFRQDNNVILVDPEDHRVIDIFD